MKIRIGRVIDWYVVPALALVKVDNEYYLRSGNADFGCLVYSSAGWHAFDCDSAMKWGVRLGVSALVVALNVSLKSTADELRALAEKYEIREALLDAADTRDDVRLALYVGTRWRGTHLTMKSVTDLLHKFRWKPSDSVELAIEMVNDPNRFSQSE